MPYQSSERRREYMKLYARLYRVEHKAEFNEYHRQRYHRKNINAKRRAKVYAGKTCRLCGVPLIIPVHGAILTRVHCRTCADNKKAVRASNYRIFKKKRLNEYFQTYGRRAKTVKQALASKQSLFHQDQRQKARTSEA